MLNSSAAPSMAQRHYGSRDCRPLRELMTGFYFSHSKDQGNI
jgi:hypothetical protein